ncbi:hypothetical protein K458DRAFT_308990 [Lentithecium fluviatile CBS 122367]|uniref:Transcription factor RfeG n=1 Tax=Lentithecium fluviatile CBS 122367 TaxID=1168545 RepID=A0A6G1IU14_9PLEO|nr:hypothetical protein K458DRAFT_308990 [Lentithecium fluviatile CBS 122367]
MSRSNQWFVPGDGIAREVITADIQRYLGPDALVRPGAGTGDFEQGRSGYWITAYRTLTSQMIQDLKLDSQRWAAEKDRDQRGHGSGAYQDSRTHASRQHYGPTETYAPSSKAPSYSGSAYGASEPTTHYTTAPTPSYTTHQTYQAPASHTPHTAAPRTDPYANQYGQQPGARGDYPAYSAATPQYTPYGQQPASDPYGRPAATPAYTTPRYFGYYDEDFLVYR